MGDTAAAVTDALDGDQSAADPPPADALGGNQAAAGPPLVSVAASPGSIHVLCFNNGDENSPRAEPN